MPIRWFRNRTSMKETLQKLFKKEGQLLEKLDVVFCSDEYLLQINRAFLNHDTYTDIITFDLANRKDFAALGKKLPVVGELYISIDRILENAQIFGVDRTTELNRVIFHGCLHLCGYGDKKKKEIEVMRGKEAYYLKFHLKPR